MAFEAKKRSGDPVTIPYTPTGGDVAAGQVVVLLDAGLSCGIATLPIANNALGTLEVGGGIYDAVMLGNYAAYTKVWWDDTNNKLTTTSTNNALAGYLIEGGTGANTTVGFLHQPLE